MQKRLIIILVSVFIFACSDDNTSSPPKPSSSQNPPVQFTLTSPAFQSGQPIPSQYSLQGKNISPPLQWNNPPKDTKGFCLIVDDPDAPSPLRPRPEGPWVHWVHPWISADIRELPENAGSRLVAGLKMMGKNDFGNLGYDGPAPPAGSGEHRYVFTLYALDKDILPQLKMGVTKAQLSRLIRDHTLATAILTGTFQR